jgi:hypothetical protein
LPGLDKRALSELRVVGFVNDRTAHYHLFKHVIRICDLAEDELALHRDTEEWSEILPNPPLLPDLRARRDSARKKLAGIEACGLRACRPGDPLACRACTDSEAIRAVGDAFSDLLEAYVKAGREAFEWARQNASERNPFLIAFRQNGCADIRLKFVDRRRVVGAGLCTSRAKVQLLTCYRGYRGRSLSSIRLDLCMERAGHRSEGTHVPTEAS